MILDFHRINFDFLGLSAKLRAAILCSVFVLVLCLGLWFDTRSQLASLESAKVQEATLKSELSARYAHFLSLKVYERHAAALQSSLDKVMQQLPEDAQMPVIFKEITDLGLSNRLSVKLFKPETEAKQSHFATVPVRVVMQGSYHQFGEFISELSNLTRVLSVVDFEIRFAPRKDKAVEDSGDQILVIDMLIHAYRQLREEEKQEQDDGS